MLFSDDWVIELFDAWNSNDSFSLPHYDTARVQSKGNNISGYFIFLFVSQFVLPNIYIKM